MAGASAAYFLAPHGSVLLVEMESQPGYHTTGRSAALYTEAYGNAPIRALTSAGRAFLTEPPDGFTDVPLLTPRGVMFVGRTDQLASLDAAYTEGAAQIDSMCRLTTAEVLDRVPVLREDYIAAGVLKPEVKDMDVNAIHQGFLRGARAQGAELRRNALVEGLMREGTAWRIRAGGDNILGKVVINAAGAWCDHIADPAGANRVGLVPKRRTAILFEGPEAHAFAQWPAIIDVDEEFYARPESGALMGSPADETPMAPCDVQPDELGNWPGGSGRVARCWHLTSTPISWPGPPPPSHGCRSNASESAVREVAEHRSIPNGAANGREFSAGRHRAVTAWPDHHGSAANNRRFRSAACFGRPIRDPIRPELPCLLRPHSLSRHFTA